MCRQSGCCNVSSTILFVTFRFRQMYQCRMSEDLQRNKGAKSTFDIIAIHEGPRHCCACCCQAPREGKASMPCRQKVEIKAKVVSLLGQLSG